MDATQSLLGFSSITLGTMVSPFLITDAHRLYRQAWAMTHRRHGPLLSSYPVNAKTHKRPPEHWSGLQSAIEHACGDSNGDLMRDALPPRWDKRAIANRLRVHG